MPVCVQCNESKGNEWRSERNEWKSEAVKEGAEGKGQCRRPFVIYRYIAPATKSSRTNCRLAGDKEADRLEDKSTRIWSTRVQPRCTALSIAICCNVCSGRKEGARLFSSAVAICSAVRRLQRMLLEEGSTIARGEEDRDRLQATEGRRPRRRYSSSRSQLSGSAKHYIIPVNRVCTEKTHSVLPCEDEESVREVSTGKTGSVYIGV